MAEGGARQGFDSPKLDLRGARDKDSLFHMSDASKSAARENDEEFRQVKDDFLGVARQHRIIKKPLPNPSQIITRVKEFAKIQNRTILCERCRVMV